jgi:hypothetical protein
MAARAGSLGSRVKAFMESPTGPRTARTRLSSREGAVPLARVHAGVLAGWLFLQQAAARGPMWPFQRVALLWQAA